MNPDYRSLISIGKFRRLVFCADQALTEFDSLKYGYNRRDKNLSIDILATILVFFASKGNIDPKVGFFGSYITRLARVSLVFLLWTILPVGLLSH